VDQRQARRTAQMATGSALLGGGHLAGTAAVRAGEVLQRTGARLEQGSATAAPVVADAVGTAVETVVDAVGSAADAVGHVVGEVGAGLAGLLEEPGVRGGAALDALRGIPVGPPASVRRWPWALGAAVLGAAAGVAVALLAYRLQRPDAPGAQDPSEVPAVVDLAPHRPTAEQPVVPGPGVEPGAGETPAPSPA
jgi:hypothetical protein